MEASEEQVIRETTVGEISSAMSSAKSYNPGLKALLSIKKNSATLETAYAELLQIESELEEVNKRGLVIIEANATPEDTARWESVLQEVNKAMSGINELLIAAKEKIDQNVKDGYPDLWKQLTLRITAFKDHSKNAIDSGFEILPEAINSEWDQEFVIPETSLVEAHIAKVESCRVLIQVIERYTPDELNSLNQIMVDHIPADFTYEEAREYQNDYLKALINFKKEFKKDKNLWDKFLDILAGGTHQSPSEGAMMERWLDGEEAEP